MNVKHFGIALSIIALLIVSTAPSVMAQGKGNGNGGGNNGGGGGGGGDSLSYNIVKLDDVGGTLEGTAYDINRSRLIVGRASAPSEDPIGFAVYWTVQESRRSVNSTLHFLAGGEEALGCNETGEIVGRGNDLPMYWADTDAVGVNLPILGGHVRGGAEAISNDGVICGWSQGAFAPYLTSAVAWRVTQGNDGPVIWGPLELETLDSDPAVTDFSVSNDISDQDAEGLISIVGESNFIATDWIVMLDGTGGLVAESTNVLSFSGQAYGTNSMGVACGRSNLNPATSNTEAVTWTDGVGKLLDIGGADGVADPLDVNDNGVVVGRVFLPFPRAVVWSGPDASAVLLQHFLKNSPFDLLVDAQAISESGEIVGQGRIIDQNFHPAFLAIPK